MGELSEQNRAHDLEARIFDWLGRKYVQRSDERQRAMGLQYTTAETHDLAKGLAALLDAARTEGRGDQEPVAWQEAAEPFFRLAREVINPVNGERPWHADSKDWMVVFSFAGQSVTLGDLRRAAVASPIREPEISRAKRDEIARIIDPEIFADLDLVASQAPQFIPSYSGQRNVDAAYAKADAILNLAQHQGGGRG